jgi:macrolide-specific efflux system membrane fusion protein
MGEPDNPIAATLRTIEPAPESIRAESAVTSASSAVYYNGLFDVENPDHKLRISMTAQVTIVLAEANNVLTIPSSALGSRTPDDGFAVQVYDPQSGTTSPRKVQIGLDNNVVAEVTKGLSEGELVVTVGTPSGAGAVGSNQGVRIGVPGAGGGSMPPPGG